MWRRDRLIGSSPRVRGKHRRPHRDHQRGGLIPACAGKTDGRGRRCALRPAHPRVCGENIENTLHSLEDAGSSPRVRGKLKEEGSGVWSFWLIPACAGKTLRTCSTLPPSRAHPRVCGENRRGPHQGRRPQGSSPRVRGKLARVVGDLGALRLIPACAGKTTADVMTSTLMAAHPRVCGENGSTSRRVPSGMGSSPRVRGKPQGVDRYHRAAGLIPACAGKTGR